MDRQQTTRSRPVKQPRKPKKMRLDLLLVKRRLATTRERAQALLMAGVVLVENTTLPKPGTEVSVDAQIALREDLPYVSRGGLKLEWALDKFNLNVLGKIVLDVGASTGGFTDCVLQRGAKRVYALDVGHGQIHHKLMTDSRVVVMERVNARHPFPLPTVIDLATVDVSFISLTKVLNPMASHLESRGLLLALVKPQFELEKLEVSKGGVVREPNLHGKALRKIIIWAVGNGFRIRGVTPSPVIGPAGNREFFVLLEKP